MLCIVSALGMRAQTWTASEVGEGKAYLYNVGTGQYLTRGNGWGTQASINAQSGMLVNLVAVNGNYFIQTYTDYGVENLSGGTVYMDQSRGKQSTWTFTQVGTDNGPVYNIVSADNHGGGSGTYLTAEGGSSTIVGPGTDGTVGNAKWKVFVIEDQKTKANTAMPDATEDNPVDVTVLIGNPYFSTTNSPLETQAWTMESSNQNLSGGLVINNCAESWRAAFTLSQTITVPNGYYKLRAQAALTEYTVTGANFPVVYLNDATVPFKSMTEGEASMDKMSEQFTAGKYWTNWTDVVTVTGKSITIGVRGTRTDTWCIWDNFQLQYLGPIDLSEFIQGLADAVAAAQAYESQLPAAVYANIASVITEYNKEYEDGDGYSAAIVAINNAVSTYATTAIVADYSRYQTIKAAAIAVASETDAEEADAQVEAATTTAEIDAAIATLRAAFLAELPNVTVPTDGLDVTDVMVDNASVRQNTNYWTIEGTPNTSYSWAVVNYEECEFYQQNFKFYQTLALTSGTWEFGVTGFHRAGNHSTYFYAGDDKILIPGVEGTVVNSMAAAKDYFDEGNGKVSLKFLMEEAKSIEIGIDNKDTETDKWTIFRDFTLKYYGAPDYSVYDARLAELATEAATYNNKIPAPAYTALNNVVTENNKEYTKKADYIAAIEAIEAAIDDAKAIQTAYDAFKGNLSVRAKAVTTAALEDLAAEDVTTLNGVISTADAAIEECATLEALNAAITTQDAKLWAGIAAAIETIELTGDETLDLTYLMTNPDLTNCPSWNSAEGWYTDQPDGNSQVMNNDAATSEDGTKTKFYEYWSNPAKANDLFALYQKVTLPEGTYNISCYAFAQDQYTGQNNVGVYFYANDTQGSSVTTTKLTEAAIDFVNDDTQEVKIGLKTITGNTYNWMGIGYVTLTKTAAKTIEISENANYTPASAAGTVVLTRTIKADVWNSFVVPFAISNEELKAAFGNDVAVAEYSENSDDANAVTVNFNTMETPAISANKPVLLKTSNAGTSYTFAGRTIAEGDAKVTGKNMDFIGTYAASITIKAGDYFIGSKDGESKLYKSTGTTTMKGTRAYIDAKNPAEVKLCIDGVATAISEINADVQESGVIYNLAGQRISKATKGIFIKNGKKVVVK